jgi:hypothetical protein
MGRAAERRRAQKQRRIFEHEVEPALPGIRDEREDIFRPHGNIIDPIIQQRYQRFLGRVAKLKARLINPKHKDEVTQAARVDTIARTIPNAYYVIVGRGAAAVVNHSTLQQCDEGRDRLGGLPVINVGMPDPWLHYYPHGMGQPPFLLSMPGYRDPVRPDADLINGGTRSTVFADKTAGELERLGNAHQAYVVTGWVASVKARDVALHQDDINELTALGLDADPLRQVFNANYPNTYPPFKVLVIGGDKRPQIIFAQKVDLCSGGGWMRLMPGLPAADADAIRPSPWIQTSNWDDATKRRKVVVGIDGLTRHTIWDSDTRICVYGSGGIGMNQIERAADDDTIFVDWIPRNTLHDTFVLPRNDNVLKHPNDDRAMVPGENNARIAGVMQNGVDLFPAEACWRFGKFSVPDVVTDVGGLINIHVTPNVNGNTRIGYSDRSLHPLHGGGYYANDVGGYDPPVPNEARYHRLILCNGQVQDVAGEPARVARAFVFVPIQKDGRLTGLQDNGAGDIRILGAAAAAWAGVAALGGGGAMVAYRDSMAVSAVPPGFIAAASNIAYSNGYFSNADERRNPNLNTAPEVELAALLTEKGLADGIPARVATAIVNARRGPVNNGIATIDDAVQAVATVLDNDMTEGIENVLRALNVVYPIPG